MRQGKGLVKKQLTTAIYTRVSTDKQTHRSQLSELRSYCRRRGWRRVEEITDVCTGAKFSRCGLDDLMNRVRRGRVSAVVCFKLDRLGRSLAHLAQVVSELTAHGVALICTSQGIDTSNENPAGRLQLGVLMAVAEFEREIIRDRVKAGLHAARLNGVKLGRPGTLDRHAATVKELLAKGYGVRRIAREAGLPVGSAAKLVKRVQAPRRRNPNPN